MAGSIPNNDYGHGRLDVAALFGGGRDGAPPEVTLEALSADAETGETVRFVARVSGPGAESVDLRWDDGYDGEWDAEYGGARQREVMVRRPGRFHVKVRARDTSGRIAEAVTVIDVTGDPLPEPEPKPATDTEPSKGEDEPYVVAAGCSVGASRPETAPLWAMLMLAALRFRRRAGVRP
jgi:MYXO-CTERM domain-containing protein